MNFFPRWILGISLFLVGAVNAFGQESPPPGADNFADALIITTDSIILDDTPVGATVEPDEPADVYESPRHSRWWLWTPPRSGFARIRIGGYGMYWNMYKGNSFETMEHLGRGAYAHPGVVSVTAGQTYALVVDVSARVSYLREFTMDLSIWDAPLNDNMDHAIIFPEGGGAVTGHNVGASLETNESKLRDSLNGCTIWWRWTAPRDCIAVLTGEIESSPYWRSDMTFAVYLDEHPYQSQLAGIGMASRFPAYAGTTYLFMADSYDDQVGLITLDLDLFDPITNNDFDEATILTAPVDALLIDNTGANNEPGEPVHSPESDTGGGVSIWYEWTPDASGLAKVSIYRPSGIAPIIAVYTGDSITNLTPIASVQGGYNTFLTFRAQEAETYHIAIDSFSGRYGTMELSLEFIEPPVNDHFADALELTPSSEAFETHHTGATMEPGEPDHGGAGMSLWWKWRAPGNGEAYLMDPQALYQETYLTIGVYTGDRLDNLTRVPWSDESFLQGAIQIEHSPPPPKYVFDVTSGTLYYIAIDVWDALRPDSQLIFDYSSRPANDDFANAMVLPPTGGSFDTNNLGATMENGEPQATPDGENKRTIWFQWTSPIDQIARVRGWNFHPNYTLYAGDKVTSLTPVAGEHYSDGGTWYTSFVFNAKSGTTYYINAYSWTPSGSTSLNLTPFPPADNDDFANAQNLHGPSGELHASNLGCGREEGEPDHGDPATEGATAWWKWTAPADGPVIFDVSEEWGDEYNRLAAYRGDSLQKLLSVGSKGLPQIEFRAKKGETYFIVVDSTNVSDRIAYYYWLVEEPDINIHLRWWMNLPPAVWMIY